MLCYVHTGHYVDPLLAVNNLAALLCCWQPHFLRKHNELELDGREISKDINTVINNQGLNKSSRPAYFTYEPYLRIFN
jgi:hypothetical protein